MNASVQQALDVLERGGFALVYDADGREEETDLTIASEFARPEDIRRMRKDGGGLICTTVHYPLARKLDLPLLVDIMERANDRYPLFKELVPLKLPYDTKSAFSLTINHKNNYTGITDIDRATTVSEFGKLMLRVKNGGLTEGEARHIFAQHFRSPGHIHLLNTSEEILKTRKGHTELCTALCIMAGLSSSATICEMMGDDGRALSKEDAKRYAKENGFAFLEGKDIIGEWEEWSR